MILNENFKLIIVSLLSATAYIQARSITQVGDVQIEKTDDKWVCDMIECPLTSDRCFVSITNEANPSVLERVNICYGEDNRILKQKNSTSSTNPNYRVRQYVNSDRNGITDVSRDISAVNIDETQHNLNIEMENLVKDFEEQMEIKMKAMEEQMEIKMKAMEEHLQKSVFG